LALLAGSASAVDHPNLSGTWALDPAHSQIHESKLKSETLQIQQKDDEIQMADDESAGGKDHKLEFKCLADGSTCKVKDESVMVYYNGPALVILEMRKNNESVLKKRLKVSDDGKTLTVDLIHVAPVGMKDEALTFVKK
jgi:hypothetical protein